VNQTYPAAELTPRDVYFVHHGFLPAEHSLEPNRVRLVRRSQIYDHAKQERIDGLISVVGVKYTTSRHVAEQVVDLVFQKLGKRAPRCRTRSVRLYGGQIDRFDDFVARETQRRPHGLGAGVILRLIRNYGSQYSQLIGYLDAAPAGAQMVSDTAMVLRAEVLHAVHEEMAQTVADVVLRRTELGSAGHPGDACLRTCAAIMAQALGWSEARRNREIEEIRKVFVSVIDPTSEVVPYHTVETAPVLEA
jgi:glycerol-3-phosphate dehydrogenase